MNDSVVKYKKEKNETKKVNKNELYYVIILSFTLCFLILIYAPLELLFGNQLEFNYNMYELLAYMVPVMVICWAILSALLLLIRKKALKIYGILLPVLIGAVLASYIQGSFFSGK